MSRNLGFARKFIILKKEFSNMNQVNPKGHGKLELRGSRLNFSLNIDNAEKNSFYNVFLIRDGKTFDLGKVFTDDDYTGKASLNFNYKELEETGFSIDRINGILIERDNNILLGGYFNKSDKSIERYMEELKTKPVKEMVEEPAKEPEEAILEEPVEEILEEPVETVTEDIEESVEEVQEEAIEDENEQEAMEEEVIEEVEQMEEEVIEEVEQMEEVIIEEDIVDEPAMEQEGPIAYEIDTEEEYNEAMSTIFPSYEEDTEEIYIPPTMPEVDHTSTEGPRDYYEGLEDNISHSQKSQTTNYILNILSFFPYTEPFKTNLQGYNWWRIDVDDPQADKGFLPYFSYITGGNHKYPIIQNTITANDLMKRYGHYLFGLYNVKDEVKFYVYGIPGRFITEDHPQKGATGFNTWFEGKDCNGYWLLYVDPDSGRIIHPINPMIPIE